TAADTAVYY
nr:immunoglobulin heavy chain junction region [Homo sapiens]